MPAQESAQLLAPQTWDGKLFTGTWTSGDAEAYAAREPATGAALGSVGVATPALIATSAHTARQAQKAWAAQPYEQRAAIFRQAARIAEQHFDEIVDWLVRESGSTAPKAGFELSVSIKALYESAALPSRSTGEILPSEPGRLSLARRRPLGVVGVISPFNFPLYLALRAVAPALALGNAVVLKPDLRTAVSGGFVIARIFELAGLPQGLLHVLPGDGATGAALVSDPHIAMIQFTGSTQAGRKVGEAAGRHLKKVSLELGGKNSLIVLDDADMDLALANAAWGAFLHQGQICMASGRILVQRAIYQKFVEGLAAKAKALPAGDPRQGNVALGPLISAVQRDHVHQAVTAAQSAGATLLAGGSHRDLFYEATVLGDVTPGNPVFNEEIFGPVAVVVPFDTDEEAIRLANDTEYGLSMAVISRNVARAMKLGEQLNTGLLHINDQTVNDEAINPFGGVGASGNGTSIGGPANLEEFTQWQWMTVKGEPPAYPM